MATVKKNASVRIINVNEEKLAFPRRYLDRRGSVVKVNRSRGTATVLFNNRVTPLEVPLDNLQAM